MFITRTISGAVLLALIILGIVAGGNIWLIFTALLSFAGTYELIKTFKLNKSVFMYIVFALEAVLYLLLFIGNDDVFGPVVVLGFVILLLVYVISWPKYTVSDVAYTLFSILYAGVCMSYLYIIRDTNDGIYFMWLIFISSWGSDTCAYCIGKLFGKHKMPSTLSPKKTIEGCIGGIAGSALIGFIYGIYANGIIDNNVPYNIVFPVICAIGAVFSQIGDLAASAVKRNNDIKDYGRLIPGHGGVMDRFDSVVFIAPIVYYLMMAYRILL